MVESFAFVLDKEGSRVDPHGRIDLRKLRRERRRQKTRRTTRKPGLASDGSRLSQNPIDPIRVLVVAIETQVVLHVEHDQGAAGQPYRQTQQVDEREGPVS